MLSPRGWGMTGETVLWPCTRTPLTGGLFFYRHPPPLLFFFFQNPVSVSILAWINKYTCLKYHEDNSRPPVPGTSYIIVKIRRRVPRRAPDYCRAPPLSPHLHGCPARLFVPTKVLTWAWREHTVRPTYQTSSAIQTRTVDANDMYRWTKINGSEAIAIWLPPDHGLSVLGYHG